jgi:hypothetical protein
VEKGGGAGQYLVGGEGRVGGAMMMWRNELGPAVLRGVGVAAVAGSDGEDSL